jgi:uncharacterized protein (DUF924 family)
MQDRISTNPPRCDGQLEHEISAEDVIRFWFGEPGASPLINVSLWWKKDDALDDEIRGCFEGAL